MRITKSQIRSLIREAMGAKTRSISDIATEIRKKWDKVHYTAKPYLEAMDELDSIDDEYGSDSANEIVHKFIGNAVSWKGPDAVRIKAELKEMLKSKK